MEEELPTGQCPALAPTFSFSGAMRDSAVHPQTLIEDIMAVRPFTYLPTG